LVDCAVFVRLVDCAVFVRLVDCAVFVRLVDCAVFVRLVDCIMPFDIEKGSALDIGNEKTIKKMAYEIINRYNIFIIKK